MTYRPWLAIALAGLFGCSSMSDARWKTAESPPSGPQVTAISGAAGDAVGATPQAELASVRESADEDSPAPRNEYAKAPAKLAPEEAPAAPPPPPAQAPKPGGKSGSVPAPGPGGIVEDPSRKQPVLIYRAEFSLSVYEVQKSLDAVEGLAKDAGGYLSRRDDHSITIRVPAQEFQKLVDSIEKVGDVLHRDVVSEDVTAEYRDLEVQLQNLLAMRARFEKLLEKAVKVEEALAIEQQLGRVTGEIERIKGRLKLLSDLARYSTITVRFEARSSQQVQQGPFVLPLPWLSNVGLRRLMSL